MKNVYQKIGKLLGEWRRKNGFSLYKIAKEGPGNVRYDSLKRVEKGDVVSSETLLCYVDFVTNMASESSMKYTTI